MSGVRTQIQKLSAWPKVPLLSFCVMLVLPEVILSHSTEIALKKHKTDSPAFGSAEEMTQIPAFQLGRYARTQPEVGPNDMLRFAQANDHDSIGILKIKLAGVELRVPRGYFLWTPPTTYLKDDILIYAVIPTLAALSSLGTEEFMSLKGHANILSVLAMDVAKHPSLQYRFSVAETSSSPYFSPISAYGLDELIPKDVNDHNIMFRHEVYASYKDQVLETYITCDLEDSFSDPGCYQEFTYNKILFSLTYGRKFLPQWQMIEESVKHLFDQFQLHAFLITMAYRPV
jgi:hypothetical protein